MKNRDRRLVNDDKYKFKYDELYNELHHEHDYHHEKLMAEIYRNRINNELKKIGKGNEKIK
jgi:hypothetical protein